MFARSRLAIQLEENREEAKGEDEFDKRLGRWGMDPARILDKSVDWPALAEAPLFDLLIPPVMELLAGRKGLVEGVGRAEDLAELCCAVALEPGFGAPTPGNWEGTVPALPRLLLPAR